MAQNLIVYTGQTKKNHQITIRYPQATDLLEMTEYINTLSNEKTFISFQGEQNTAKEEKKYLDSVLKEIKNHQAIYLHAYCGNKLIGITGIKLAEKVEKHVGILGISVSKQFRGDGIGKLLMNLVLTEAKTHLPTLKICTLSVFGNNKLAMDMYKQIGFLQHGLLPNGILHQNTYVDHIYMYKVMP